jgi:hypothetical protein
LIYATLAGQTDRDRSARLRHRARRFATDWEARFDAFGRIVPYGRSLTYRFGGAAFWGALAFADEEALLWGQVRGLWAQHLRWWAHQSIGRSDGALSVGWAYENLLMSETYNGPGSPYWALKAFLPLAVRADHPFWAAPEAETGLERRHLVQRPAVAVVNRDEQQSQLLNGGRGIWFMRQGSAKYGKFAYSSAFTFCLDPDDPMFLDVVDSINVVDSMLVLRDADHVRRVRSAVEDGGIEGDVVWSRWHPFPDVEVVTVLYGEVPWHARLHYVRAGRALETFEGGFALGVDDARTGPLTSHKSSDGVARIQTGKATSLVVDAGHARRGAIRTLQPNTNLVYPRSVVPGLDGKFDQGTQVLGCMVAALEAPRDLSVDTLPAFPDQVWQVLRSVTGDNSLGPDRL